MKRYSRSSIYTLLLLTITSCSHNKHDTRLENITYLIEQSPLEALDSLNAISYEYLSSNDQHFYDFLHLKASDKAYVTHTSDSTITNLLNWYRDKPLYPEVLYYGGRVYSDLGDYPRALHYFQDALDAMTGSCDLLLQRNTISQTGRLLSNMALYEQAIPYLEESLRLTASLGGANMHYDHQLLGRAYTRSKNFTKAAEHLNAALMIAKTLSKEEALFAQGLLAELQYEKGSIDSALVLIRNVPENILPSDRDFFKACAADIYYESAAFDSARIYAKEIIYSPDLSYRVTGYRILLKPELRKDIAPDTLTEYLNNYLETLTSRFNEHSANAVINQNSFYNYSLIERRNIQLSRQRTNQLTLISVILALCLVLVVIIYFISRVAAKRKVKLIQALQAIRELNKKLMPDSSAGTTNAAVKNIKAIDNTAAMLKQQLHDEINRLKHTARENNPSQCDATDTRAYTDLQSAITSGLIILDDNPIWDSIEQSLSTLSPEFKSTLYRLSNETLSNQDYQLAALIRLGIQPAQVAALLGRVKGTISYRRKHLCIKLFHGDVDVSDMDNIIRLL